MAIYIDLQLSDRAATLPCFLRNEHLLHLRDIVHRACSWAGNLAIVKTRHLRQGLSEIMIVTQHGTFC